MNSHASLATLFLFASLCAACATNPKPEAKTLFPTKSGWSTVRGCCDAYMASRVFHYSEQVSTMMMDGRINSILSRIEGKSHQFVLVSNVDSSSPSWACLYAQEQISSCWKTVIGPIDAVIGRNGFAPSGAKREGDGMTPSGVFSLTAVFGYHPSIPTYMPYHQVSDEDVWVDDPNSIDYNTMTKKGRTAAASFELMKRNDDLYEYGIITDYNVPVVKGNGSAIFVHVWVGAASYTSGCIAMSKENLVNIIEWLDPMKKPLIILGPELIGHFKEELIE